MPTKAKQPRRVSKKNKPGGVRHHHITRVMYVALVGFFITTGLVLGIYSQVPVAQATPGMIPFGGPIAVSIPSAFPNPAAFGAVCPAHTVILDLTSEVPKLIGIATLDVSIAGPGLIFDYGNLLTPGVETLGEYAPFPILSCSGLPYEVFQGLFNVAYGRFQLGTGAIPGI